MPPRRRPARRPKRKPARRPRKARLMPVIAGKGQRCTVVETIEIADLNANSARHNVFCLLDFARASNIAPNFKFYRAAKVIWTYDPLFNTFQDGNGNANASKPYMYTCMSRTQFDQYTSMAQVQQFQASGARPVPLVGQRKISYRPNWCSPGLLQIRTTTPPGGGAITDYSSNGLQAQYGWLATPAAGQPSIYADGRGTNGGDYPAYIDNPPPTTATVSNSFVYTNTVIYNGHHIFIDQKYTGGDPSEQPVARVTCTVLWECKEAQNPTLMTPPTVTTAAPLPAVAGA